MIASKIISSSPRISAGIAARLAEIARKRHPSQAYLMLFAAAILFFLLNKAFGQGLGPLEAPVAILGSVTCGMSWLLTRSIFRTADHRVLWPKMIVATLLVATAIIVLTPETMASSGRIGSLVQTLENLQSLASSTVLVLTLIEPIKGFNKALPSLERHFRLIFIGVYAALVVVAVLMDRPSAPDQTRNLIKMSCAVISLFVATAAVMFRTAHPLTNATATTKRPLPTPDVELQRRILQIITVEELYKIHDLKVADIARRLGEPSYRVSQCMNGIRGFQNFNRLINSFRIDDAKAMLADTGFADWSILSIAMECGFGSIGPFNRAFKESIGTTPMLYRARHQTPEKG